MQHNSLKAYGAFNTAYTDDFILTFHNSLFYYICSMNEFIHFSISLDEWIVKINYKYNYHYNCLF